MSIPSTISVTPFAMTAQAAQAVWGQILKDASYYEPYEAARFGVILEELGYKPEYGFMIDEWDTLQVLAGSDPVMADHRSGKFASTDQSAIDHAVDFQYHRIGHD